MILRLFNETFWLYLIPVALLALIALLPAQHYIHIFQLESYKRPQFFLRLKEDPAYQKRLQKRCTVLWFVQLGALALVVLLTAVVRSLPLGLVAGAVMVAISLAGHLIPFLRDLRQPQKKPLKYTSRVIRLNVALALCAVLLQVVVYGLLISVLISIKGPIVMTGGPCLGSLGIALAVFLLIVTLADLSFTYLPNLIAVASVLVQPMEKAVQAWYLNDAKKKLAAMKDLLVVGITGSYGKTSAKVILATILSEKYKTYATPASYNTPMGLTRAIREQLDASHQVFIAEMGARHMGDIAELCRLVRPKYGLLTSVGPQHLETMFTIENITRTKYELIESLPPDGMGFLPSDNEICLELYKKTEKPKALFGFDGHGERLYMAASGIEHGHLGSTFTLTGPDGQSVRCTTKLLGKHNVQNILGCAAVAYALGLTMEEIARGIAKAQPVEHRLQLVPTANGITVIDDAFNSNPAGARAALEVLGSFPGRKIIVTPGLVELGDAEEAENEAFGRAMAPVVDIAILVARNAAAMKKGLLEAGFPEDNLIVTGKLAEATAALGHLTRVGDVVLFENDLPDHYET